MDKKRDFLKSSIIILFVLVVGIVMNTAVNSIMLKGFILLLLALITSFILSRFKCNIGLQGLDCLKEDIFNLNFKIPEEALTIEENQVVTGVIKAIRNNLKNQIEISTDIYGKCENLYSISKHTLETAEAISSTVETTEKNIYKQKDMIDKTNELAKSMNDSMIGITEDIGHKIEEINNSFKSAEEGLNSIEKIEEKIKETKDRSYKTSNRVGHLQKYSDEVGGLIDLIAGISKETKMLSLNASIEAARAGEEGKGFVVVAKEVGKLAEETEKASSKIEEVILILKDEISRIGRYMSEEIAHMDSSYKEIKDISGNLGSIIENVNVGRDSLEEIHTFTRNNMNVVEEITNNINKINTFTGETTDQMLKTTEQTIEQHKTASFLEESLNSIKNNVFTLQQFVGGQALEETLKEKVDSIELEIKDENNISDDRILKLLNKYNVDSIYISDISGYVKYTNEKSLLGVNLYDLDLEMARMKNGSIKYMSSPIKKRVEDGKMFKFMTSKDSIGRLVEVGISVENIINDIKN